MRNINHERPELRFKDNIHRESVKACNQIMKALPSEGWPIYLQPLAQNPQALKALASFMREMDLWTQNNDDILHLSRPPENVKNCFDSFLNQRIDFSHSSGLTVKDWLDQKTDSGDLRHAFSIFRELWS
jgi:hypothetical protein